MQFMSPETRILHNAKIYTFDDAHPICSAMAMHGGQILALGDDQDILTQFGGGTHSLDIGGAPVIPGLIDAHIHLRHYAQSLDKIDCEVNTLAECLRLVDERAQTTLPGDWILGHGWNQNDWSGPFSGGAFPTAADLDKVAPNNPVFLTAKSLHTGWANSAAMRDAGIDAHTPDPDDGTILHNEHGNPTGIFLEGAMWMVDRAVPEPGGDELAEAIARAQRNLWQMGITGVHDFDRSACFDALQRLHLQERLQMRVVKNIPVDDLPLAAALGLRSGFGDDFMRIGAVKAFADGALGPHTAAMLQPYENAPADNQGMLLLDAEQVLEYGREASQAGLPLTVHAIGDRANHEVLNALEQLREFERSQQISPDSPLRHRIEHVQIIHPEDAPRLAQLGIIASMQPIHATSDMLTADRYWGARSANAYTWKSQLKHDAVLAFGSDAPVESPNPFWGLHAAVTRRRADGTPGPDGWYPTQRLSIKEALHAYTQGAAYAAGTENVQGKLAPGYWADLVVLDRDPFECAPEEIRDIRTLGTMVAGEWVLEL
jgi:predicted amidohydrolase YtcJ